MHVKYIDPIKILSIVWTLFMDGRIFFGTSCTKADLEDAGGVRPEVRSLKGLIATIKGGVIPTRDDILWEFRKEYLKSDTGRGGPNLRGPN